MSKRLLASLLSLFVFLCSGCGSDSEKISYDVSAQTSLSLAQNPVAIFRYSGMEKSSVCTAFLIKSGQVLTNGHCIRERAGAIRQANDMTLHFKNLGDKEISSYRVAQIERSALDDEQDWAILEPESKQELLDRFGGFEVFSELPPVPQLKADLPATLVKVTPRSEGREFVLESSQGELWTSVSAFRFHPFGVSAERADEAIRRGFLNLTRLLMFVQAQPGNSGSPVLYEHKAIGILFKGATNVDRSHIQWLPGLKERMKL